MAMKLYSESSVKDIADAIREKNGSADKYKIAEMAQAILDIPSGGGNDVLKKIVELTATELTAEELAGLTVWNLVFSYNDTIRSIEFPDGMYKVAGSFEGDQNLASVTFPSSLREIGNRTFLNCKALTSIFLPEGVTKLGYNIWQGCTAIKTVDLPSTMTVIDNGNWSNCTALVSLTCRAKNPPRTYAGFYGNVPSALKIYVPAESVELYKTATGWSVKADNIEAIQ